MADLPSCTAFYTVSVHQTRGLPVRLVGPSHPDSFRFHLTMGTLSFGCILPATGRIGNLHSEGTCTAMPCLKNVNQANGGIFSVILRRFSLQYTKYCYVKSPCLSKKFLTVEHISNFQTRHRCTTEKMTLLAVWQSAIFLFWEIPKSFTSRQFKLFLNNSTVILISFV